jgi:exodeoxyribonuclease V alpha subunit
MEEFSGGINAPLRTAAALASRAVQEGNVCVDLSYFAGMRIPLVITDLPPDPMPPLARWIDLLSSLPVVTTGEEARPLVLRGNRLYLFRYWSYENRLAEQLRSRSRGIVADFNPDLAAATLAQLFYGMNDPAACQKTAAAVALLKRCCLISGGPGTGKTSTVVRIAALLATMYAGSPFTITLAAPTGKAATRLEESIAALLPGLPCSPDAASAIPTTASTVHALLGPIPDSPCFRHDAEHPLACDVLIVDEASMLDLALMTRLIEALPTESRIILIGDRNQLASVEAGPLLADLCGSTSPAFSPAMASAIGSLIPEFRTPEGGSAPLPDCVVALQTNYRFGSGSGIGQASLAVNSGDFNTVISIFQDASFPDCAWRNFPEHADRAAELEAIVIDRWNSFFSAITPQEALARFADFRILCAVRNGPFGTGGVTARIERFLVAAGVIPAGSVHYRGQPVMITRNDYAANLFNGDIGVVLPDAGDAGTLKAYFPAGKDGVRAIPLGRLPLHETAWAMTVHKTQGSEFGEILLILPERPNPLVTRELLYTGMTRARRRCELWCSEETLRSAVATPLKRVSGLREKLGAS